LYNYLCFGDPFTLGYAHQASYLQMKHGLFGIQWPNLIDAFKMLFPQSRGAVFLDAVPSVVPFGLCHSL
jgi:hypothetical protein